MPLVIPDIEKIGKKSLVVDMKRLHVRDVEYYTVAYHN